MNFNKIIAAFTFVATSTILVPSAVLAAPHHFNHHPVPIHRFHHPKPIDRHHFRIPPVRDHRFIPPYHHRIHPPVHSPRRVICVRNNSSSKAEIITGILGIVGIIIASKNAADS